MVVLAANEGPIHRYATVTVPVTAWAECDGTFVNAKGLAQTFKRALQPKKDTLPAWDALSRIGRAAGLDLAYRKFKEVRAALVARTAPPASKSEVTETTASQV